MIICFNTTQSAQTIIDSISKFRCENDASELINIICGYSELYTNITIKIQNDEKIMKHTGDVFSLFHNYGINTFETTTTIGNLSLVSNYRVPQKLKFIGFGLVLGSHIFWGNRIYTSYFKSELKQSQEENYKFGVDIVDKCEGDVYDIDIIHNKNKITKVKMCNKIICFSNEDCVYVPYDENGHRKILIFVNKGEKIYSVSEDGKDRCLYVNHFIKVVNDEAKKKAKCYVSGSEVCSITLNNDSNGIDINHNCTSKIIPIYQPK
jgi:hypothetical protein